MQKRRFVTLTATLIAAVLVTTIAQSQDRRRQGDRQGAQRGGDRNRGFSRRGSGGPGFGGGGSSGGLLSLLRIDGVKKEIKLDGTQEELVKVVEDEVRGEQPQRRFDFGSATDAEREKYFAERRAQAADQAKAAKEMLATVLAEEQMKRLTEISIQVQGIRALSNSEVEKLLKITGVQKETIAKVQRESEQEMQSQMRELFGGGRGGDQGRARGGDNQGRRPGGADRGRRPGGDDRGRPGGADRGRPGGADRGRGPGGPGAEIREKMEALRAAADKKVLAVLSEEQQKQFADMKGKKFDMPRPSFGGRGGGGFQRGGSRGGPGGGGERRRPPIEP